MENLTNHNMDLIKIPGPSSNPTYFQVAKRIIIGMKFQIHMCHSAAFQQAICHKETSSEGKTLAFVPAICLLVLKCGI